MIVDIPEYLDSKESVLSVVNEGCLHVAWKLRNGKILVVEYIPYNNPHTSVCIYENYEEYVEAISDVDWIVFGIEETKDLEDPEEIKKVLLDLISN